MGPQPFRGLPDLRVGLRGTRFSRWTTLAALALGLAILVMGIVYGIRGAARPLKAGAAPAWHAGVATCPTNPLNGVHDPERFLLVAPCSTVSGTVTRLKIDPVSGELEISLAVPGSEARYLRPGNTTSTVVARVSPRDIPTLTAPAVHGEAALYGAWVVDRARNAAELDPTYAVVPLDRSPSPVGAKASGQASGQERRAETFTLDMNAANTVQSGGVLAVTLHAQRRNGSRLEPVSQMHALVELMGPGGQGIRWRAAVTNTQGNAHLRLLVLDAPGHYLLTVFGYKNSATATLARSLTVTQS